MKTDFTDFRDAMLQHLNSLFNSTELYVTSVDTDVLYNIYLDSFPEGTNPMYRVRREFDCSCCRHFIRDMGNVVAIQQGKMVTIWDFDYPDSIYTPVLKSLSAYVKKHAIVNVFRTTTAEKGCMHSHATIDGIVTTFQHFYAEVPRKFVTSDIGSDLNRFRTSFDVFERALTELTLDSVDVVLELITTNSLYRGSEWRPALNILRKHMQAYAKLKTKSSKRLYIWDVLAQIPESVARIRNTSMGTLLIDISNGVALTTAVDSFEHIVAPENYKRSKPIFTQAMLDKAQSDIEELGYLSALNRRFANLNDITVNDILYCNKDVSSRVKGASDVFGTLAKSAKRTSKKFSGITEISVSDFINKCLPSANSVEVFVDSKHRNNFVSLISPVDKDAKSMFKWGNNFTWAYSGNVTDSIKDRVKSVGGCVTGDLRFSIQWNECGTDNFDLDAHCVEPNRFDLGYDTAKAPKYSPTKGQLDIDIIHPDGAIAVENITWASRKTMVPGSYKFYVHQFSGSVRNGFRAEIEFDGQIYSFNYPHGIPCHSKVEVATVTLDRDGVFSLKPSLDCETSTLDMWNVPMNDFVPVSVICYSPNFWENSEKIGHQHLFFMLKDCINDEQPSGIFNEFLVNELYAHRHVMEALGNQLRLSDADDQLSGLGFALDKRAELVVKVHGATERLFKIKF